MAQTLAQTLATVPHLGLDTDSHRQPVVHVGLTG